MSDDLQAALDEINAWHGEFKPWRPLDDDSCWAPAARAYSTITEAEWRSIDRLVDSLHDGRCIQADLERERDQARRLACQANERLAHIHELATQLLVCPDPDAGVNMLAEIQQLSGGQAS